MNDTYRDVAFSGGKQVLQKGGEYDERYDDRFVR